MDLKITKTIEAPSADSLHVKRDRKETTFNVALSVAQYQDKATKQFIIYIPSLDLSSYGETPDKANEMMHFLLKDFLQYLGLLSTKKLESELRSFGWKHDPIKHKDFSKAFVDITGTLQEFALDKVEMSIVTA